MRLFHAAQGRATQAAGLAPQGEEATNRFIGVHRQAVVVVTPRFTESFLAVLVHQDGELASEVFGIVAVEGAAAINGYSRKS